MSSVKQLKTAAIIVFINLLVALVMVMAARNTQSLWSVQLNQDPAALKSDNSSFARHEESYTSLNQASNSADSYLAFPFHRLHCESY